MGISIFCWNCFAWTLSSKYQLHHHPPFAVTFDPSSSSAAGPNDGEETLWKGFCILLLRPSSRLTSIHLLLFFGLVALTLWSSIFPSRRAMDSSRSVWPSVRMRSLLGLRFVAFLPRICRVIRFSRPILLPARLSLISWNISPERRRYWIEMPFCSFCGVNFRFFVAFHLIIR